VDAIALTTVDVYTAEWSKASRDLVSMIETFAGQFIIDTEFHFIPLEENSVAHQKNAIRIYPTLVIGARRHAGQIDLIGLVEFCKED